MLQWLDIHLRSSLPAGHVMHLRSTCMLSALLACNCIACICMLALQIVQ